MPIAVGESVILLHPLYLQQVIQWGWRGRVSRMAVSSTAARTAQSLGWRVLLPPPPAHLGWPGGGGGVGGGGGAGGGGGGSGGDGGAGVPGGYIYSETAGLTVEMRHRRRREQGEEKDGDCRHVKYLPARVKQIGKIESRGKVLKLSDKVVLTRPFTARGNCLP